MDGAKVELEVEPGRLLVRVAGELDYGNCDEVIATLSGAIAGGPPLLAVDLAEVTFFGSDGVRCMVVARSEADAAGVPFVIRRPSSSVTSVLELLGMTDVFPVTTD